MGRETVSRSRSKSQTASPSKSAKSEKSFKSLKSEKSSKSEKSETPRPAKKSQEKRSRYTRESLTNPFLNFMRDYRKEVRNDKLTPRQIISMGSQRWRGMSPAERATYIREAEEARKHKRRKTTNYVKKRGRVRKSFKFKKRDASICRKCGYYIRKDDQSRDPSTCTTVSTRTSRSPSDSCEEFSDDSRRSWR